MSIQSRPNEVKQRLQNGDTIHLYVTGNFASPRHVDFICQSGLFEAIWFDLEHFDIPTRDLATLNLVTKSWPVATIARSYVGDYQTAARLLETGVGGLMCAMVNDAAQARCIVEWAKFNNPQPADDETTGRRGWNGGGIDGRYGNFASLDYIRHQNRETMLICQIETEEAVANARSIAETKGIDGLFFGPGDYSHLMGVPGQIGHPSVVEAMTRTAEAAAAAGKWWGTVVVSPEGYAQAKAMGARLICPGGDVRLMNRGLAELAKIFQSPEA